jgi:hypothetical protein
MATATFIGKALFLYTGVNDSSLSFNMLLLDTSLIYVYANAVDITNEVLITSNGTTRTVARIDGTPLVANNLLIMRVTSLRPDRRYLNQALFKRDLRKRRSDVFTYTGIEIHERLTLTTGGAQDLPWLDYENWIDCNDWVLPHEDVICACMPLENTLIYFPFEDDNPDQDETGLITYTGAMNGVLREAPYDSLGFDKHRFYYGSSLTNTANISDTSKIDSVTAYTHIFVLDLDTTANPASSTMGYQITPDSNVTAQYIREVIDRDSDSIDVDIDYREGVSLNGYNSTNILDIDTSPVLQQRVMFAIINDGDKPKWWWSLDSDTALLYKQERLVNAVRYPTRFPTYDEYANEYTIDNLVNMFGGTIQAPIASGPSGEVFRSTVEGALTTADLRGLAACLSIPTPEVDTYIPPNSLSYFPLENSADDVIGNVVLSKSFGKPILSETGLNNRGNRSMQGTSVGHYLYTWKFDQYNNNGGGKPPTGAYDTGTISDTFQSANSGTHWMVLVIDTDNAYNNIGLNGIEYNRQAFFGTPRYEGGTVATTFTYNGTTGELRVKRTMNTATVSSSQRYVSVDMSSVLNTGLHTVLIAYTVDGTTNGTPTFYNSFTDTSVDVTFEDSNSPAIAALFHNALPPSESNHQYEFRLRAPIQNVNMKQAGILVGNTSITELRAMRDALTLDL